MSDVDNASILWIVPKWPYPVDDGARRATVQLLKNTTAQGERIHLAAIAADSKQVDTARAQRELGVESVHVIRRAKASSTPVGRYLRFAKALATKPAMPITLAPYTEKQITDSLETIAMSLSNSPITLVYDGLHCAAHSTQGSKYKRPGWAKRVIYRAHNFESSIWERNAALERNPIKKALLLHQAKRVQAFEASLVESSDATAPVSDDDLQLFRSLRPGCVARTVPIGYPFGAPLPEHSPFQLMFIGRLDWPPNRDGLKWMLEQVWPKAKRLRPDLELVIAGSGDTRWTAPFLGLHGVRFLGRVDDVEELYRRSSISLVPIFYGSGTRVKVIEASRFGRACISTALGVEGTGLIPGESYLRAESEDDWAKALVDANPAIARKTGIQAHAQLREKFDESRAAHEFRELLK